MSDQRPAVLLLSGGLDSTTMLAYAIADGFDVHAMTFRYGQRHVARDRGGAARGASATASRDHVVVDIDLRTFGGSALTADIDVPKDRSAATRWRTGIPITYVPARNTIFLSFCLAWAEVLGASDIFIGVNALDYSGYPDCRPEYVAAFERMANLATRGGVEGTAPIRIQTPLLHLTKRADRRAGTVARRGLRDHAELLRPGRRRGRPAATATPARCGSRDSPRRALADPAPYAGAWSVMPYVVKEIFYTLQGEGQNAGRPAVFCRFAGCNLWTGREAGPPQGGLPVLRHRFRRRRAGRRPVRRRRRACGRRAVALARGGRRARRERAAAGRLHRRRAAAPARRRRHRGAAPARLRGRGGDERHAARARRARPDLREPEGERRRSCSLAATS